VQDSVELRRLVVLKTSLPKLIRPFFILKHHRKHVSARLQGFIDYGNAEKSLRQL
jgi:hypothetical protein